MRIAVPAVQRQRIGNVLVIDRHRRRHRIRQLVDPCSCGKARKEPRIEVRQPACHVPPPNLYTPSFTTAIMSISIFRPARARWATPTVVRDGGSLGKYSRKTSFMAANSLVISVMW